VAGREFITAVEEKALGGPQDVTFTMGSSVVGPDGEVTVEKREVTAHPPRDGQVAMMMARMGRHSSTSDKIAGIIDFFVDILDDEDHQYVVGRLMDRNDPFGIADVTDIMGYLVEEWAARPTRK
jgi:hypothetical protein